MKILYVVHQFLPRHRAGTELYTHALAKEMQRRGHDVALYVTEIDPARPRGDVRRAVYDELPLYGASHDRRFAAFRDTYADPDMDRAFQRVLDDFAPDVVHFQHLLLHGIGAVGLAARRGLPTVVTLHDYWPACLRDGLLLRPDGATCAGPETDACASCAREKHADLFGTARRRLRGGARSDDVQGAVERRRREVARALDAVDLFVSPSAFLRERFVAFGLVSPDRIVHSENGHDVASFAAARANAARARPPGEPLRVGSIGAVGHHKGVHVLVDAMAGIDRGVRCRIHGPLDYFPDYARALARRPGADNVELCGPLAHEDVPRALAQLDALVVPSIWFENAPLSIHEAFAAGVPVVASDCGGMAELVDDGVNGLLFARGDAADLRAKLVRLRDDDALLARLRASTTRVETIAADAAGTEARYRRLAERRASRVEAPAVTILIPTLDAGPDFADVVDCMLAQKLDRPFEMLVVDSGSTDGTVELLRRRDVRVIEIPNAEFDHGATRNLGLSEARGEIVALATQDARPFDDAWLQSLVDCFDDPRVAGAYSRQLPRADADPFIRDRLSRFAATADAPRVQEVAGPGEFDALPPHEKLARATFDNVSSAVRASVAREIPFRARRFGEDVDWAHRAIVAGWKIAYQPASRVVHSHDGSIWYELKRVYLDHQNLCRTFGLRTVPRRRDVLRCTAAAVAHLWRVVDAARLGAARTLYWKARAIPFALTQNLAQYLGARSVERLRDERPIARLVDRVLGSAV